MTHIQQLRKGSTPLLILSVLADGKMYGYQIMRELESRADGYFKMTAALLYPALHQLEKDALVRSEWEDGQGRRRRKYYTITHEGLQALESSRSEWQTFVDSLYKALQPSRKDSHLEQPQ